MRTARAIAVLAAVLLASGAGAAASPLEARVRKVLAKSAAARGGFAGILVEDARGRRLVAINAGHYFVPASNTKLFSTALALQRLGPAFTVTTRLEQRGRDLLLVGAGDANLSGRQIPYVYKSEPSNPLSAIEDLAAQIAARGTTVVEGDIVADDSAFQFEPYAHGWAFDDILNDDGPPVSALVVNDNVVECVITPGLQEGAAAQAALNPAVPVFTLTSTVTTGAPAEVHLARAPASQEVRVWGQLPVGEKPYREYLAVDDPARFAALALKGALERRGVAVRGGVRVRHWLPGTLPSGDGARGSVVAQRVSPPLLDDLRVTDKVSQNLHADLLLFTVARALTGTGSREAGLSELAKFLSEVGIAADGYRFLDGSGLSRLNLVTPETVVKLLRYMKNSPRSEAWESLLPVNGVDGSLAERMAEPKWRGRIRAKTGGLTHVSALSGYLHPRRGADLVFSIFLNNYGTDAADAKKVIDQICAVLVQ